MNVIENNKIADNIRNNNKKHLHIIISKTPTRFAYCIRKFGNLNYNHASISLDDDLKNIYAFARPQHHAIFLGTLVKESLDRFTLRSNKDVPVVVFRLDISDEQYLRIKAIISMIQNDPEYMYNLFSVVSYPITKGFETYKAYTCVEFVLSILDCLGYHFDKPLHEYRPDDLLHILHDNIIFEGDIRDCVKSYGDDTYFTPLTRSVFFNNIKALLEIMKRSLLYRG